MFSNNSSRKFGWKQLFLALLLVTVVLMVGNTDVQAKGLYKTRGSLFTWGDKWHPPRAEARGNLMGHLSEKVPSRIQGVCYDMLENEDKAYYLYLGFQFGILEPVIGWSFRDKEWVGGLRSYPQWDKWRGYTNFEYQIETQSYYFLGQIETHLNDWIEGGFELEGWGDIDDKWSSNGFGLNMVFNLQALRSRGKQDSKLDLEAAVQYREMDGLWKPQFIVRFIFTPKMEEHTPSRRRRG